MSLSLTGTVALGLCVRHTVASVRTEIMTFERRPLASTVNRIHRSGAGGGSMIRLGAVEHKGTRRYRAISAPICSVLLGILFPGGSFAQDIAGKLIGRVQTAAGQWLRAPE